MSPISKENNVLTATPDLSSPGNAPRLEDTASRPQPVALEVPVTVNGARTVEGSDKREPFSETTKTVLVFGNGAVIRLGSPVAPGQLLFLTNEKTKKEVVCQVVKSKNYRSVSGYVELEFTEPVVGFWGMRFPSERPATAVAPRPAAVPSVSAAGPGAVPPAPKVVEAKPLLAEPSVSAPVQLPTSAPAVAEPTPPALFAPATQSNTLPEAPATKRPEPPPVPVAGLSSSLATSLAGLLDESEQQTLPAATNSRVPSASPLGKQAPPSPSNETEELKLQAARLQEQLSSMLFKSAPATSPPTNPAAKAPAKPAPSPLKSSLDTEEVKIPSWLEPLARNAAAPATTQELIEREKAKHSAELASRQEKETAEEPLPITEAEPVPPVRSERPGIGNLLPLDDVVTTEDRASRRSGKGLVFGAVAAGLLVVGGGAWYFLQPADGTRNAAAPLAVAVNSEAHAAAPAVPTTQPAVQPNTQTPTQPDVAAPAEASKATSSGPSASQLSGNALGQQAQPHNLTPAKTAANSQPPAISKENPRTPNSAIPATEKERIARPAAEPEPEPKKQALGEVHLASPMMSRRTAAQNDADAPSLTNGADAPDAAGLGSDFAAGSKQPAAPEAPLPVGGDVKAAKLLSSVSPVYPAMAKSQHVSGDVVIDALIGTNGRVTTMKVISGPGLLHQAAMDALRQWKYAPASLDGNPVAMHLTVKIQFRIQ